MPSFNKVIVAGFLTRDPEFKYSPKGTAIANIGIAVNRNWTSDSGEKKEEVTFVDVTFFGKTAETIGQYLKKGRPILIEGRLKYDQWDDRQSGQKRSKLGVIGESFQFLESGDSSRKTQPPAGAPPATSAEAPAGDAPTDGPPAEDDVPF